MAHGRARIGSLAVAATLLSLTACGTSSSGLAGPKLVTFPGDGTVVTIKNVDTALKDTSPAFRTFISNHLHELWKNGGAVPGCEGSALVSLTAYSATGFASAS